jgi:hypothetical protein
LVPGIVAHDSWHELFVVALSSKSLCATCLPCEGPPLLTLLLAAAAHWHCRLGIAFNGICLSIPGSMVAAIRLRNVAIGADACFCSNSTQLLSNISLAFVVNQRTEGCVVSSSCSCTITTYLWPNRASLSYYLMIPACRASPILASPSWTAGLELPIQQRPPCS